MALDKFKRIGLVLAGVAVWSLFVWEVFSVQQARSYTPFINNVRRALNECNVVGRLANEQDATVSFNARIICNMPASNRPQNVE